MKIALDTEGTIDGFFETIDKVSRQKDVKSVLVLTCAENDFSPAQLDSKLANLSIPVFGGLFPAIIHQQDVYRRGTLALGFPVEPTLQVIEGLSREDIEFDEIIDVARFETLDSGTMLTLVDGMSLQVNSFLGSVFDVIGLNMGHIGGGASSLDFEQTPSVFTNGGLKQDCALLAHLALESGIGVSHGMESVGGPYRITGASFNRISAIDWQPAAQFYRKLLTEHPAHSREMLSYLDTDAHFSLGLNRFDSEHIVLEPIQEADDGSLVFMQEVQEGEYIDIMHVDASRVIDAAATSKNRAMMDLGADSPPETVLTFDCVSRWLFLGDRFNEELRILHGNTATHVGALTCGGEIGTNGSDYLDYHNRTCVVGAFSE